MAANLVALSTIKALSNIAEMDVRWDVVLNALRSRAGADVEDISGRSFDKVARIEFFQSYSQEWGDPSPQWLFPNAFPIDTSVEPVLVWAPFDDHDANGTTLVKDQDWRFETDNSGREVGIRVQRFSSFPANFPLPLAGGSILRDSPTGFKLTYTGGFDLSAAVPTPPGTDNVDPFLTGEALVVQFDAVDSPLGDLVAQKVAADFQYLREQRNLLKGAAQQAAGGGASVLNTLVNTGAALPWNAWQRQVILSHARKDLSWARPSAPLPTSGGRGFRVQS